MLPSEKIANRYAEIFVSAFERITDGGQRSLVVSNSFPQQYANGKPCQGGNLMLTSLVSAMYGYRVPVWLTANKLNEIGCLIRKGEHGVPIVNYTVAFRRKGEKTPDWKMTDELNDALSPDEKKEWVRNVFMKSYSEFNIEQTNFPEVYPDQWAALQEHFQVEERLAGPCEVLDRMVSEDTWLCPIIQDAEAVDCRYMINRDEIVVPERSRVAALSAYYNRLVHEMAHSTGSELRMDRVLDTTDLKEHAKEELIAELSSAIVGTVLGIETTIQDHNLSFLKSWCGVISEDPNIIYTAVYQASGVADTITKYLGVTLSNGYDLDKLMVGVEAAQKAKEEYEKRREQRSVRYGDDGPVNVTGKMKRRR